MQFDNKHYTKIQNGDALTDTELQIACDHFEALEGMLLRMGPQWHLARMEAISESNRLRSYRTARTAGKDYRPQERGQFQIRFDATKCEYRVSIPNYDGGTVVTLERHEAAVADAYLRGRMSRMPANSAAATAEVLEGIRKQIRGRWNGGYPQEVIEDLVDNVLDPAIQVANAVKQ